MARYIQITDCRDCIYGDHKGAFGTVSCVPVCREKQRELPHTVERGGPRGNRLHARLQVEQIPPTWCPLPKSPGE